jgi:hypothetical protein
MSADGFCTIGPIVVDATQATLVVGLAGVAGTLAAGGMGQMTVLRLEARRERSGRQRRASEVLCSVRLVDEELGWNARVLLHAQEAGASWEAGQGPSLDSWREHGPGLAGELDPGTWGTLARAAMAVRVLLRIRAELDALSDSPAPGWESAAGEIDAASVLIQEARILIRPVPIGGSTFPRKGLPPGSTWLPAVPELGPWDLWSKRRWRLYRWSKRWRMRGRRDESERKFDIVP